MLRLALLASGTWLFPAIMVVWNVFYFVATLFVDGKVRINVARYAVLYALTVPAAARGDMNPFYVVLNSGDW